MCNKQGGRPAAYFENRRRFICRRFQNALWEGLSGDCRTTLEAFEERFRGLRGWKNRKLSKKDSGGCPKDRRAGRFRRKIPKEIEKQGENQNEYIIKMDQRFSAGT